MSYITIILISVGLCFDTFAVSVSSGIVKQEIKFFEACKIAFIFAIFQAGMPIIGWVVGEQVKNIIASFDHWVVFAILFLLGLKMILESIISKKPKIFNPNNLWVTISMAIATSIDALAVGISFSIINISIILTAFIIGTFTYLASMTGILIGKKSGIYYGKKMEILGGIILILIGIKIVYEHIFS
jgi:manganese efflux pump family protein